MTSSGKFIAINLRFLTNARRLVIAAAVVFALVQGEDAAAQSSTSTTTAPVSSDDSATPPSDQIKYSFNVLGGYTFAAGIHGASGNVSKSLAGGEFGVTVPVNEQLSFGATVDAGGVFYKFNGPAGLFAGDAHPWGTIRTFSLGLSGDYHLNRQWTVFAELTGSSAGEDDSTFGDTLTIGGIAGVEYIVSKKLTIGVGIATLSRLEADPYILPFPLIDWILPIDRQDRWRLQVGGTQTGASETAGVKLVFSPSKPISIYAGLAGIGLGSEFRLSNSGPVPGGVGRSSSYPIVLGMDYHPTAALKFGAFAGATTFGTIDDIDHTGNRVGRQNLDPAPVIGLNASFAF